VENTPAFDHKPLAGRSGLILCSILALAFVAERFIKLKSAAC
jgi:hypothetical protein